MAVEKERLTVWAEKVNTLLELRERLTSFSDLNDGTDYDGLIKSEAEHMLKKIAAVVTRRQGGASGASVNLSTDDDLDL